LCAKLTKRLKQQLQIGNKFADHKVAVATRQTQKQQQQQLKEKHHFI